MKKNLLLTLTAAFILILGFGQANADPTLLFSADCPQAVGVGGTIDPADAAAGFNVDIWVDNVGTTEWIGGSLSFRFYSPGGGITTVTHGAMEYLNGWTSMFMMTMEIELEWDGTLPDDHNITPMSVMAPGMAPSDPHQAYIRYNFTTEDQGEFCIDSIQPSVEGYGTTDYDWLFLTGDIPAFNGQYCWTIGTGTDVADDNSTTGLPKEFGLSQNYPNPFNPTTTIELALPVASDWNVTIYNIAGQTVESFSGFDEAGTVSVIWDATNQASGMYFYQVQAGEFSASKKMMLLK